MTTYCILGGGGSFALHTARYLLDRDQAWQVWAVGRAPPKPYPFHDAVLGAITPRFRYDKFHVTYDFDALTHALLVRKPEVIINFAAQGEGATSFTESWRYFETNCVGLSRLVEWLVPQVWLKRFVHIGSSEVYGSTPYPANEDAPLRSTSPYALSKAAFDEYLLMTHKHFGFPAIIMRPSNCYGEGQQLHRLIPRAFLCGLTGRKLPLHGGGMARKSWLHSRDLARAIDVVLKRGEPGLIYNVGPERPTAVHAVAEMIAAKLDIGFPQLCQMVGDRAHQDAVYSLDSGRIRALGWSPSIAWGNGLEQVKAWAVANLPALRGMPTEFVMRP